MSIDLTQFHQVFFEESIEGLDIMESSLLELNLKSYDDEEINTIFRAAHSIKGGSGTFGFQAIADFTHVLETLLDQVRDGSRTIEQVHIELLLKSVDCVRAMIADHQNDKPADTAVANDLRKKFEAILSGDDSGEDAQPASDNVDEGRHVGWKIYFKPEKNILTTGNEPVRMLRELKELGEYVVLAVVDQIPSFSTLHPEECYLAWHIQLTGDIPRAEIDEVFEWVVDECELIIEEMKDVQEVVVVEEEEVDKNPVVAQTSSAKTAESTSIRVGIDKIDQLINMVGELVITQSMLSQIGDDFDMSRVEKLISGLDQLEQNTRELQESVMRIRMLPISFSFSRFPRMVRDLSLKLDKKINLVLIGEQTELDKTVMEKIGDPLVHLVRNSLDHGIEMPADRIAAGKSETGTITLNAFHQGGNIIIEIIDDGGGLNSEKIHDKAVQRNLISSHEKLSKEQINDLIFQPGFSTADTVSDVSGRGVGMDVVRKNIQSLNGSVEVESTEGVGSTFRIRLPLTLAILDGQLVRLSNATYIVPLINIVESLQINQGMVSRVAGGCEVFKLREEYVPIVRLYQTFGVDADSKNLDDSLIVVMESDNEKVGVLVDELMAQQQVVIKSLEDNYQRIEGVSGATILGDGRVALILDVVGLIKMSGVRQSQLSALTDLGKMKVA